MLLLIFVFILSEFVQSSVSVFFLPPGGCNKAFKDQIKETQKWWITWILYEQRKTEEHLAHAEMYHLNN